MQYLVVAVLLGITIAVIALVVRQGMQTVESDTGDLAGRYAHDAQAWQAGSVLPPIVTRVYISREMRESDADLLAKLGYRPTAEREITWPRAPRLWVITWTR
jgi:hypothetical protein